ncbi:MAG: hypothetical protein ACXW33_09070, partial [Sulfuricurvum sp.]
MQNELLIFFVGIIAVCMVVITIAVVIVGLEAQKTSQRINEFLAYTQSELNVLSTKAVLTLHEVNELMVHLKTQTYSLGNKSFLALNEVHELISYVHNQTKDLAHKASSGIAKVTLGSLLIGAV